MYTSLLQSKFYSVTESILIVHLNFSVIPYSAKQSHLEDTHG